MMDRQGNILDPIHDGLSPLVWDNAFDTEPVLKPIHALWIKKFVYAALRGEGYNDPQNWLSLVFTGSLTTYQYSDESDVDISLFVDTGNFPDWDRAAMIGVMVENCDGIELPGTPHPMQCFVVPPEISKSDLYQPGLRSGWDLELSQWIVPPEKSRVRDVQKEMNSAYVFALECADKMERLIRYEPQKAEMYWEQIHHRRRRDHQAGKGDYSQANIVYKMLANRGLFPQIAELTGTYIA